MPRTALHRAYPVPLRSAAPHIPLYLDLSELGSQGLNFGMWLAGIDLQSDTLLLCFGELKPQLPPGIPLDHSPQRLIICTRAGAASDMDRTGAIWLQATRMAPAAMIRRMFSMTRGLVASADSRS